MIERAGSAPDPMVVERRSLSHRSTARMRLDRFLGRVHARWTGIYPDVAEAEAVALWGSGSAIPILPEQSSLARVKGTELTSQLDLRSVHRRLRDAGLEVREGNA